MEKCCSGGICESLDSKKIFLISFFFLDCVYLNWKSPFATGGLLAGINLFFLLLTATDMNLLVILTYIALFYVVSGVVIAQFLDKTVNE
jgi:hypothetical protein